MFLLYSEHFHDTISIARPVYHILWRVRRRHASCCVYAFIDRYTDRSCYTDRARSREANGAVVVAGNKRRGRRRGGVMGRERGEKIITRSVRKSKGPQPPRAVFVFTHTME